MAATKNCNSCANLQENSPNFVQNGVTDTVCTALKNDKGFDASNGHNDCTDLNHANDCLIGNMEDEVDAYGVCDWKEFTKNFIHNLWSVIKAMICAICGIWTNIHNLWDKVDKHDCEIAYLFNGASFSFGEKTSSNTSRLVPGLGVSFAIREESQTSSDVTIDYIAGGLARLYGSLTTFTEQFKEADGSTRNGNAKWNWSSEMLNGGELLYELRIKKSEFPQIKRFFNGHMFNATGGPMTDYICNIRYYNEGVYAFGQHGRCNTETGAAIGQGSSDGHKVPDGYMYIQVRMQSKGSLSTYTVKDGANQDKTGNAFTPSGYLGIRTTRGAIEC